MADFDNETLISLVEQRPVIWDKTLDTYRDKIKTRMAWYEICQHFYETFDEMEEKQRQEYVKIVISKWTNIRDNHLKAIRRINETRKLRGVKRKRPYLYHHQLAFLMKIIEPRETSDTFDLWEDNVDAIDTTGHNSDESTNLTGGQASTTTALPKRPVKRKSSDTDTPVKFVDPFSLNSEKDIRHLSFFRGILPSLHSFNEDEILEFQMGVLSSIRKIKEDRTISDQC